MIPVPRTRGDVEAEERERLGPWAVRSGDSAGRVVAEPPHAYRSEFQRDRDRIVHSRSFRRLEYKTQVFVYHEGDHYRNRLTHTLEAAQITRTIARSLRLNEDLAEAVVLAHDLGHPPFAHAGERALDTLLAGEGGFDHNRQSLRVVDLLEERYPDFRGLNLTAETRAGLLKHGCAWEHPVALPTLDAQPSLEAQVADESDEIAYTNHDLEDGLSAGILDMAQLDEVDLWREARASVAARVGAKAAEGVLVSQTVRALINRLVTDLVEATAAALRADPPGSAAAAQVAPVRWVRFSPAVREQLARLKRYLSRHFYTHPRVVRMNRKAEQVLGDLFRIYREEPEQLPPHTIVRFGQDGAVRALADYIAGMTDRFALDEHRRLLDLHERI